LEVYFVDCRRGQASIVDRIHGRDLLCLFSNEADVLMKRICRSRDLETYQDLQKFTSIGFNIAFDHWHFLLATASDRNFEAQGGVE
jgi:hypothetical protein